MSEESGVEKTGEPAQNTGGPETDYQTVRTVLNIARAALCYEAAEQRVDAALAALERMRALSEALERELEQTYDQDDQLRADLAEALDAFRSDFPERRALEILAKHAARAQAVRPGEPDDAA